MHHSGTIPSFIYLGNVTQRSKQLRKHLHNSSHRSPGQQSRDQVHSSRLLATPFTPAMLSHSDTGNAPPTAIDDTAHILRQFRISRDQRMDSHANKRRGRPATSRVRGKHGPGKSFNSQTGRYDTCANQRNSYPQSNKDEPRLLRLQSYIHNRRLRLRQRLIVLQNQSKLSHATSPEHSDDAATTGDHLDAAFDMGQSQHRQYRWEIEQKLQERTQSAAKSRSHFLMERRISAGEKVDRAQLVVQRQRSAQEKRQLKVRHDLEQKMLLAMERRNAYLEAAIENDPSRRFRRKSQAVNIGHETIRKVDSNATIHESEVKVNSSKSKDGSSSTMRVSKSGISSSSRQRKSAVPAASSSPPVVVAAAAATSFASNVKGADSVASNDTGVMLSVAKNSDSVDVITANTTTKAHLILKSPIVTTTSPSRIAIHNETLANLDDSIMTGKDMDAVNDDGAAAIVVDNTNTMTTSCQPVAPLKLEEKAIWAQRRIRERLIAKAAQEYMQVIGSHDHVLAMGFDQLARLLHTNKTLIQATLKLLKYSSQQVRMSRPDQARRVFKAPARVFLSMYMVLAHPTQIRSPLENENSPSHDDESFQDLVTSAKVLLESMEKWLAAVTLTDNDSLPTATHGDLLLSSSERRDLLVKGFDNAWASYYGLFQAWKTKDAQRLLQTLLDHARQIESLWTTVERDPAARSEWMPRVEEQRRDLREKARQLAGEEGVARLDGVFSVFVAATQIRQPQYPTQVTTRHISQPPLQPLQSGAPVSFPFRATDQNNALTSNSPADTSSDTTISVTTSPRLGATGAEVDTSQAFMEHIVVPDIITMPEIISGTKRPRKKSAAVRDAEATQEFVDEMKAKKSASRQFKKKAAADRNDPTDANLEVASDDIELPSSHSLEDKEADTFKETNAKGKETKQADKSVTRESVDYAQKPTENRKRESQAEHAHFSKIEPVNFERVDDKESTDPLDGFERPTDWTKVKLIHELALDPSFKIESHRAQSSGSGDATADARGGGQDSLEARIRTIATKAYFDSIREDAAKGQLGKWIPSIVTRIREQLLEMVPSTSSVAMRINEALDLEFVQQQVDHNVFDVGRAITIVLDIMAALCAPIRDARRETIAHNLSQVTSLTRVSSDSGMPMAEPLRLSSDSGNDLVSVLQDVLELLDDMLMDMANFRLMAARPSLEKQAIPYEQKAFTQALKNKEVTLDNVKSWLQKAADTEIETMSAEYATAAPVIPAARSESVQSPLISSMADTSAAGIPPSRWASSSKMIFNRHFAVFARAFFNILFSSELVDQQETFPETLHLDRERLVKYQNEIQALVLTAGLVRVSQDIEPQLTDKEQLELKDNILELMEKPYTSLETLTRCVIEAKENAIISRRSMSTSTRSNTDNGELLSPAAQATLTDLVRGAVNINSPVFKLLWGRMRSVLEASAVAPRYTIAMPTKKELVKLKLEILEKEIEKLAESLRFLAKYNANVYHSWYDPMLTEMLRRGGESK